MAYSKTPINSIKVDSAVLKKEFAKRGYNCATVAAEIGRSKTYLTKKLKEDVGLISSVDAKLLRAMFNIDQSIYEVAEPVVEAVEEVKEEEKQLPVVVQQLAIDEDKLYKLIYSAVYQAVKKAWENE